MQVWQSFKAATPQQAWEPATSKKLPDFNILGQTGPGFNAVRPCLSSSAREYPVPQQPHRITKAMAPDVPLWGMMDTSNMSRLAALLQRIGLLCVPVRQPCLSGSGLAWLLKADRMPSVLYTTKARCSSCVKVTSFACSQSLAHALRYLPRDIGEQYYGNKSAFTFLRDPPGPCHVT